MSDSVKTPRRYDATRRQDRARRAREEVIDAGTRLFVTEGFAATTVAAVAQAAGVSAETIYKSFGGKAGLVRAIWARALEGEGATPAEERSDGMQATEHDPHQVIRRWGEFMLEVAPRVAPILLLIKSAASVDPEMATLLADVDEQRRGRMERNARTLHNRRQLRQGMTLSDARDILWTYSSPELFELLVVKSGWSTQQFARFVSDQLISALLPSLSDDDPASAASH